jgi:hypothetical protein
MKENGEHSKGNCPRNQYKVFCFRVKPTSVNVKTIDKNTSTNIQNSHDELSNETYLLIRTLFKNGLYS